MKNGPHTFNKKVLVLGVNGQDGSYIAESQVKLGNYVYGVGKQDTSRWVLPSNNFEYIKLDLLNLDEFAKLLILLSPDLIFHFSAVHGPSGFNYESVWNELHIVNTHSVNLILDYIKNNKLCTKLIYASSSKSFSSNVKQFSEDSLRVSDSLYTISKNTAFELIKYYRINYEINSSVIWLFNHESTRRPKGYFVHKITDIVVDSLQNKKTYCDMGNLDFWCDWGDAQEYMNIVSELISEIDHHDFLLSTGNTINAQLLCMELFSYFGLDAKIHIKDFDYIETNKHPPWVAYPKKLFTMCQNTPKVKILDVCIKIVNQKIDEPFKI